MATMGSQRLLRIAVGKRPELLLQALRKSGAVGRRETVEWASPLSGDEFREYRDGAALKNLRLADRLTVPLRDFWRARGQVWDALGVAGSSRPILLEAKAHIPEMVSRGTQAAGKSLEVIKTALTRTREHLAPKGKVSWTGQFYQYANRLAFQYYLRELNHLPSTLVFLYFLNAVDMDGPASVREWKGASRLVHACLGLPEDLTDFGVFEVFVDARLLMDA